MLEVGQVMVNRTKATIIRGIRRPFFCYVSGLFRQPPPGYVPALPGLAAPTGMLASRQVYSPGIPAPGMMLAQQGITSSGAAVQV